MSFIFLDESGDLGFRLEDGSSRFFVITVLFTRSKRRLEKIARKVHGGLAKKHRRVGVLHAYKEKPATRRRVLEQLCETDCRVLGIVLNKEKVYTKLQDEKAVLYNYVTNILLDRLIQQAQFPADEEVVLIASRRETNRFLNENFRDYLTRQTDGRGGVRLRVEIATPHAEKALQVADFASWAIFRKYEHGDDEYYRLIEAISSEAWLFP